MFTKKPLNQIEFSCRDAVISAIYGFLKGKLTGGEFHDHISFELHLIAGGCGAMVLEKEICPIGADTLLLVPPHTAHYPRTEDDEFEDLTVMFACRRIPEATGANGNSLFEQIAERLPQPGTVICIQDPRYGERVKQIKEAMGEPNEVLRMALIRNLLENVFLHLLQDIVRQEMGKQTVHRRVEGVPQEALASDEKRKLPPGSRMDYPDFLIVKRIDEYIQRLSPAITLDGLAEYINMSRRSTQRLVSGLYGQSFSQKLADFRLHAALTLMTQTDKTLAKIAEEVGYEEYTTFQKAFRKKYGIQPSVYRRINKQNAEETYNGTERIEDQESGRKGYGGN